MDGNIDRQIDRQMTAEFMVGLQKKILYGLEKFAKKGVIKK